MLAEPIHVAHHVLVTRQRGIVEHLVHAIHAAPCLLCPGVYGVAHLLQEARSIPVVLLEARLLLGELLRDLAGTRRDLVHLPHHLLHLRHVLLHGLRRSPGLTRLGLRPLGLLSWWICGALRLSLPLCGER